MPQLLFLPLQHWREPPCSLWSQQWTGPPFSSWTQVPSANEHSEILSARTSIKPWRFVWSISQNVLLLSLEPDVWKKILVAVLFTTNTKNQGMTRAITQEVSNVFSFSLAACQSTRIQNISRWQGFFRAQEDTCVRAVRLTARESAWQITTTQSFIYTIFIMAAARETGNYLNMKPRSERPRLRTTL